MTPNLSLGAKVKGIGSAYDRATGMVDSHMFGASLYHPDEGVALGYGVELDDVDWVFVHHGQADAILLGRELMRNPYWPLLARTDLDGEIAWPNQYLGISEMPKFIEQGK